MFCVTLAACGGGGGGSAGPPPAPAGGGLPPTPGPSGSPTPKPTPTPPGPTPTPTQPPSGGPGPTTFNLVSVPAGLALTIVDGATSTNATAPATFVPVAGNTLAKITFTPTNGNPPFLFVGDQRSTGPREVLYNQVADTSGSLATVSSSSVARATLASSARLPLRFSFGSAGRPLTSATRLVVRYRTNVLRANAVRASDVERATGFASARDIGFENAGVATRLVDVPAGTTIDAAAARLRARPEIASADPERLYYTESTTPFAPNDPYFPDMLHQWALFDIFAPNAWGYTKGSASIAIAVIDTGADFNQPDLAGGRITYAERVLNGTTTVGAAAAQDTDGHGSNVAGIAAANTNNGVGIAGVGFNTSLQIYRVFPDGTAANNYAPPANSGDITQAIYDAVAHGAKVINLSLGTCQALGVDTMQRDAVSYAAGQGVTVVAASGNERAGGGTGACSGTVTTVDFPAAYNGAIAVGATKLDDSASPLNFSAAKEAVAPYSNSGPGLALVAPGGSPVNASDTDDLHWIFGLSTTTAANPAFQCPDPTKCYALFAGTSQASPHVAGVAALMLAANPALTPGQIRSILTATADDLGDPYQGAGRLNAYRALAAVTNDPAPPALPAKSNFVAFAYVPNGTNVPKIVDVTYTTGTRVFSNGTFRLADIPASATGYKIGVWADINGDGVVDQGDFFASTTALCAATAPCAGATGLVAHPVPAGFVLN